MTFIWRRDFLVDVVFSKEEYLVKFADILGKKKAAKLYIAEEKFKKELIRIMKQHRDDRGPGHGGPHDRP